MEFLTFLPIIIVLIGVVGSILWLWMLIECAIKEPSTGTDKMIWILIILFTHCIGAAIYLLVRRPKRQREVGR